MPTRASICGLSVALLAGAAGLSGCLPGTNDAGHGWSMDKHVYASDVWQPKTVTLTDTATGEVVWVSEVPVGQQVVVRFFQNEAKGDDPRRPDQMKWATVPVRESPGDWDGTMDVPGRGWRRLSFELRPAPELPRTEAPVMEPPALDEPAAPGETPETPEGGSADSSG
ncbi:MAG: hypothetical protein ACF8R7_05595 [Phycisphaerales bacterium JB039]